MKLKELCVYAGLECSEEFKELEISEVTSDSERCTEGCIFVAIRGIHRNGEEYVWDAIKNGACVIVSEGEIKTGKGDGVCFIKTDNARKSLALMCDKINKCPSKKLKVIAVNGTNGKTSVSSMIYEILSSCGIRVGLIGTVACVSCGRDVKIKGYDPLANMTTPDPEQLYRMMADMVSDNVEYLVMEITSHALALDKCAPIYPIIAIFTNLTPEHLDFHGNMKNYLAAKAKLFESSEKAIVNIDDKYSNEIISHCKGIVKRCTVRSSDADYRAEDIENDSIRGVKYRFCSENANMKIECRIPGEFTVINTLEAASCALMLGISPTDVQSGIKTLHKISGRLERVRLCIGAPCTVFIDYAHTPDALEKLLRTAGSFRKKGQRLVLVFGCGGDRDRSKRKEMGAIATKYADLVIVTSDNSRSEDPDRIILDIMRGIDKEKAYRIIKNRRDAIEYAIKSAEDGDIILLAGKGHENYEIDREGRHFFDERELAADFAAKYYMK